MLGPILRKYGVEATINFALYSTDGASFKVDAAHAAGDTVIMKNEGAQASTTNAFTDEGTGYSLVLTATEMTAARIVIYVADQTSPKVWLDLAIVIETYGNASAQHEFDLDTGIVEGTLTVQHALRLMLAALTGKATGGGTATITFRDTGDTTDRLVMTVDANGNRSAVVRTAT